MPSRKAWLWLLDKEWRELLSARAFWLMLLFTGPLVGTAFITAVGSYAELSGLDGTATGAGEALSPLVGIWAPTFSGYELVAAFLLPFVAIRVVSDDAQSGALKLEQQQELSPLLRMTLKAAVLLAGWLIASLAAPVCLLLWVSYGGSTYLPEIAAVLLGHVLDAGLTVALAAPAAQIAEHPATAAILTLGFTVGTWILSFVAAVRGGPWERLAGYTPPVMVGTFQHGLVRLDLVVVALLLIAAGLATAAVWMRIGVSVRRRVLESGAVLAAAALAVAVAGRLRASWDLSESRYNSFAPAEEAMLAQIHEPLRIEVHLAAEDPRRSDLERHVLAKLRRVLPALRVDYVAATATGLFEQASPHYGEIWYELRGRREMSRRTAAEAVLETIHSLAGIEAPAEDEGTVFRGHPLAVPPRGAAVLFYGIWPAVVLGAVVLTHRSRRRGAYHVPSGGKP